MTDNINGISIYQLRCDEARGAQSAGKISELAQLKTTGIVFKKMIVGKSVLTAHVKTNRKTRQNGEIAEVNK